MVKVRDTNGRFGSGLLLRKGDLVEFKAKIFFSGEKNYHSVVVIVNGDRYKSLPQRGVDYWATGLKLIEDRLPPEGSLTQKLWEIKDNGVQVTSTAVNVDDYGRL